jgi:aryl-alcohol dehydrogenase-like predicted oxidoreductase
MRSVETSLTDLGLEYVDFMLVHDPDDLTPVFAPSGALEALLKLKAEGMVRSIGLGVRTHEFHRQCMKNPQFDLSLTYSDYNLLNQSAGENVIRPAAEHNVGVYNAMVVEYGLLSGRNPHEVAIERKPPLPAQKVDRAYHLWNWARSEHLDLLSLALQFSTRDTRIASTLVGVANPVEIENDIYACQNVIPESAWNRLTQMLDAWQ